MNCYPLLSILALGGLAFSVRPSVRVKDNSRLESRHQLLVHITDPQLGMLNQYQDAEDWKDEEAMLTRLAAKSVTLQPSLVFVGGDMQNWWPNEKAGKNRNRPGGMSPEEFQELCAKDLGRKQRASVRKSLEVLSRAGIPVSYTPGNHDIGDNPDLETLEQYTSSDGDNPGWGPLFQHVREEGGILYLQFNSQIYWSTDAFLDDYREKQLEFLKGEIKNIQGGVKRLVLLTHIPPFMDSIDEQEGWANWKKVYRRQILDLLAAPKIPMLWVCGHFHANVVKDLTYQDVPVSIRVTSAAGTTMQWDGKDELAPKEAQEVASKDIAKAFAQDIGFSNIKERLKAESDRSGLRVFKIDEEDGSFEDKWYTLDELQESMQQPAPLY